jgi:predicted ester cyclase
MMATGGAFTTLSSNPLGCSTTGRVLFRGSAAAYCAARQWVRYLQRVMASNADAVTVYWESCWNDRRTERLVEVFHDPYTHGRTQVSPARMAAIIDETVASLPDVQVCVDETEVLSDVVITRSRFIATHSGVIFGLDPTGKAVNVPTLDIFFFRDGKVARYWHLTDHLPILVGIEAEVRIGDQVAKLD